tara:strand:+ start:76 stop:249 length:174 start_codon:yes stop_codon:yes gene_type:complete
MNYKDYSITNFCKWGYFQAFNLLDNNEPMIQHKLVTELKTAIDLRIEENKSNPKTDI